ncbi:MAG: hypothetical protein HGB22_08240 [Chlorobiaceae bacterium]|nr:hypothetical protein [Chlorobiaceae bacterium]
MLLAIDLRLCWGKKWLIDAGKIVINRDKAVFRKRLAVKSLMHRPLLADPAGVRGEDLLFDRQEYIDNGFAFLLFREEAHALQENREIPFIFMPLMGSHCALSHLMLWPRSSSVPMWRKKGHDNRQTLWSVLPASFGHEGS